MMVLGTVRLVCAAGDYASAFLAINGPAWPSLNLIGRFLQENSLTLFLAMSWPLVLGLVIRRSGSRVFLVAATITFLILGFGGVLQLVEGLSLPNGSTLLVGSFGVSRLAVHRFILADLARLTMGTVQLALELATAVFAGLLAMRTGRTAPGSAAPEDSRRRLRGRLAIYLSLAFLVLGMRMPFWTAYLEILNRSNLVRDFVLRTAPPGEPARSAVQRSAPARNGASDRQFRSRQPAVGQSRIRGHRRVSKDHRRD